MTQERWALDADELRSTRPQPRKPTSDRQFTVARALPRVYLPIVFRMIVAQVFAFLAIQLIFVVGRLLNESRAVPSLVFGTAFVALILGLSRYVVQVLKLHRLEQDREARLLSPSHEPLSSPSILLHLLVPALGAPTFLVVAYLAFTLCQTRFQAAWVLAILALYVFYCVGSKPIHFYEQYWLAHQLVTPQERNNPSRVPRHPHMWLLLAILYVTAFLPGSISTGVAILLLCTISIAFLAYSVWQLRPYGNPFQLAHYFLRRAVHLCRAYLDYEDVLALQEPQTDPLGNHAWIPPQDQATRQSSFYLLLISLQLVLLVGLSFYCPWEVFVQAAEPDQLTELASHWTIRPIVLALRATPHSAALFCWCIATLLFIFLPPLVLLTLYLRCVVAIEPLRQMILQRQRSIQ